MSDLHAEAEIFAPFFSATATMLSDPNGPPLFERVICHPWNGEKFVFTDESPEFETSLIIHHPKLFPSLEDYPAEAPRQLTRL